jgi:hypothetical protein
VRAGASGSPTTWAHPAPTPGSSRSGPAGCAGARSRGSPWRVPRAAATRSAPARANDAGGDVPAAHLALRSPGASGRWRLDPRPDDPSLCFGPNLGHSVSRHGFLHQADTMLRDEPTWMAVRSSRVWRDACSSKRRRTTRSSSFTDRARAWVARWSETWATRPGARTSPSATTRYEHPRAPTLPLPPHGLRERLRRATPRRFARGPRERAAPPPARPVRTRRDGPDLP